MVLKDLDVSIRNLPGIGPKAQEAYSALGVETVLDLVQIPVRGYEDRSHRVCIGHQTDALSRTNTIVKVLSKSFFGKGRNSVKALVEDTENGVRGELLGFNRPFLDKVLFTGCYYHLFGNAINTDGLHLVQFSQFEIKPVKEDDELSCSGGILPVFSLAGSLTQNVIRRDVKNAFSKINNLDEVLPEKIIEKYSLLPYFEALRKIHFPYSEQDIIDSRRTLAFTEMFYMQIMAIRKPQTSNQRKAVPVKIYSEEKNFIEKLPFKLTDDQLKVLSEIRNDMSSETSMNRLLQGDVGCGKTLVAWISAIHSVCEGNQVAFMAPTELLARQHASLADRLFRNTGMRIAYLDGQVHGKSRELLLNELADGNIDLLIGTHALFSKDVVFRKLGYVIIDEQHRFGVEQRTALFNKGQNPDVLLMTATPIPRTLALTMYGNLNVSTIKTMPKGRMPIKTFVVNSARRDEMYKAVEVELERGHQAYFVYPRIEADEENNSSDLRDVETMYDFLSKKYGKFKGALIHSKLDDDLKVKILDDFSNKKLNFLVATSVVEVGIDVPDATCMVVEHAEIFGLSALHQLRGRVGRSTLQSWCFLVYEDNITEDGKKRLSVLHSSNDGFVIAEEDLKIRGPGEISGLRQSGFLNLKFASLDKDIEMMAKAREEVNKILEEDAGLLDMDNSVIRNNLKYFETREAI